jgi:LysR family glycine cleavage system transcriptional activator
MQYRQTPPIQLIPIFEAAARHLSFKKAADELCVTAPAVGQQVKAFEQWLGKPLFQRKTRSLSLTDEGKYYFSIAQDIMQTHCAGYSEYTRQFDRSVLSLSTTAFIAQELIMPNYLSFEDYAPGTELRIESSNAHVNFETDTIDATIRFGDGTWPGVDCKLIDKATVTPVCSPSYLAQFPLSNPSDLQQHRLIYAAPEIVNWGKFFYGPETTPVHNTIICDSYLLALKSATDGLGVALAILPSANSWINAGRLVLPFALELEIDMGFWLVTPKGQTSSPQMEALYLWTKSLFSSIPALDRSGLENLEPLKIGGGSISLKTRVNPQS